MLINGDKGEIWLDDSDCTCYKDSKHNPCPVHSSKARVEIAEVEKRQLGKLDGGVSITPLDFIFWE